MQPGFRPIIYGVDDGSRDVAENGRNVHDYAAGGMREEMWKEEDA